MSSRDRNQAGDAAGAHEFALLLSGHANRDLTAAEADRLHELARRDVRRQQAVAEVERVHGLFQAERDLRIETQQPLAADADLDETWQRLQRAAAGSEAALRARLRHSPRSFAAKTGPASAWRRWLPAGLALAAAAALVVGLVLMLGRERAPSLIPQAPGREVLGPVVLLAPELRADSPSLAWHAVPGAFAYHVVILDEARQVVVQRADAAGRSTRWDLSAGELAAVQARPGPLFLRVTARDGAKVPVASSGDLELKVR